MCYKDEIQGKTEVYPFWYMEDIKNMMERKQLLLIQFLHMALEIW